MYNNKILKLIQCGLKQLINKSLKRYKALLFKFKKNIFDNYNYL